MPMSHKKDTRLGYTVCVCPTKKTPGLNKLMPSCSLKLLYGQNFYSRKHENNMKLELKRIHCLFELMLYVPVNSNCHVGTSPPFYGTFTQH